MRHITKAGLVGAAMATLVAAPAIAQNAWDMPTPYGDGIFHTQNIMQFAEDVRGKTEGSIDITVHSANSLFGHAEIKDAVRDGLVPIGEILLSRLANEDPIFALDSIPFLASSYDEAEALWAASREAVSERLAEQEERTPGRGPLPEAAFLELVNMVAMQAVVSIGGYQLPTGEVVPPDLAMAEHQIDLLEVLEKKTAGNLTEEEKKALSAVLYELRPHAVPLGELSSNVSEPR